MMTTVILPILFGLVGWWSLHFCAEPIKRIYDQIRQAQEDLIFHGFVGDSASQEERVVAMTALRKAGAALLTSNLVAYPWVSWWFRLRGYKLGEGGAALVALSNLALLEPETKPQPFRVFRRDTAEKALKLPLTYRPDDLEHAREQLGIGGPSASPETRLFT